MIGDLYDDTAISDAAAPPRDASTAAPEADEPASQEDKDELLRTAKKWFREDRDHSRDWRIDAKEDFDFAALRQWSEEDKRILRDQMRPEITFDKIGTTVKTIVGIEVGNRREVRYYPRTIGESKQNDVLTAAAQWARDGCDAEDEETDAFRDCIICGMGWIDTRMDYERDPQGMIVQERLDPIEMYWDAAARKPNLADARRSWRVRTIPIEDARLLAPDAEDWELDAAWARDVDNLKEPHNADPQVAYQQDVEIDDRRERDEVTVVHLQYWERQIYYRVAFNGRVESIDEDKYPELQRRADTLVAANIGMAPMKAVKQVRKVYKQALIGANVLSMGPAACEGHFTWECITGDRDQNEGSWYGIVRIMKDPQRWANKWLSQSLHILNSNAKGGLFAERGAFDNDREAEESYARSDRITWLKAGALAGGRIQQKQPPSLPQNLSDLMAYALSSIRDASGVNLELAGLQDQQQSGVLAETRKQSGMTVLATLFDSLRRYRKRQGRTMLYFIMNYISDGRLIRIVGPEGASYVPLVREPELVEYDVIVDDDPTSTNQKEKVWATMMAMMPFLADKLDASDIAILFEYSPLPQSVVETWQKKIAATQAQQQPIQQAQVQSTLELAQTKAALQAAQAQQAQATAAKTIGEAQAGPQGSDAATDAQLEYQKLVQQGQIDYQAMMADANADAAKVMSQHQIGQMKIAADLQNKREQRAADAQTEQGWMNVDANAQLQKAAADLVNQQQQRAADANTEAGWMNVDANARAHSAVMSAAGKLQAAKIVRQGTPRGPNKRP